MNKLTPAQKKLLSSLSKAKFSEVRGQAKRTARSLEKKGLVEIKPKQITYEYWAGGFLGMQNGDNRTRTLYIMEARVI
jgi:hypothetical protein